MRIIATLDNNPLEKEAFSDLTLTEYEAENIVKEKYYEKGRDDSDYLILSINIPFFGEENNENEYDDMIDLKRSISDYTEEELKELGETYLDEIYNEAKSNDSNVFVPLRGMSLKTVIVWMTTHGRPQRLFSSPFGE